MCDLELKDVVDVSKSLVPCIVKASEKMQSAQLIKTIHANNNYEL